MTEILTRLARRLFVVAATGSLSLVGMGVGAALAQQAQPVQPQLAQKVAGASDPATDGWLKICATDQKLKKEVCHTTFDLRTSTGQLLANFDLIEATGEARRMVRLIVPTGMLLQEGIGVKVDDQKVEPAKFNYCAPDACVSQFVPTDALVANIKKGKVLVLSVTGQAANPITYQFSLANFGAVNAGKAMDEATLKKRAEILKQELEQQQQSLEDQIKAAQKKAQQQSGQ